MLSSIMRTGNVISFAKRRCAEGRTVERTACDLRRQVHVPCSTLASFRLTRPASFWQDKRELIATCQSPDALIAGQV